MTLPIARILVGVDFSEPSQGALALAIELGGRLGASLELLHAYQVPTYAFAESIVPAPADTLDAMVQDNRRQLEALAQLVRAAGIDVATQLVPGQPEAELVERAGAGRFDLVIVGTHGRTGLSHALLGSVAEKVVRRSPVPVLTVPSRDGDRGGAPA